MRTLDEILGRRLDVGVEVSLRSAQVDEFAARGFTSVARITSPAELAWLGELYDWLFGERVQAVPGGYFDLSRPYDSDGPDLQPQLLGPEVLVPELRKTALFQNGRRLAAVLLAAQLDAVRGWGHMIRKPARIGAPLPWHQDEAYWDPGFDYTALGVWLPLDPATHESGCMSFIPGSHRGEVRKHRHVGDDPAVHALFTDDVDERQAVALPLAPGGAILHHCRTLHSSGPNRSERPWVTESREAWEARNVRSGARA